MFREQRIGESPVAGGVLRVVMFLAVAAAMLAVCRPAPGQKSYPSPLVTSVQPTGCRAGESVEVTVLGDDLDDLTQLLFSNPAIKAERLPDPPEPEDKDKKDKNKTKKPAPPARFKVSVAANAPVGLHDVRAVGKWGVSNPRAFTVGDLPEVAEKESNNDVPDAQEIPLDAVINGVVKDKIDVDYYKIDAKKGERIVVHCASSSIDSRLMPLIEIYNEAGSLLGSNHHYLDRDAVVDFRPAADGKYFIRLCEFAYQAGGNDYFYRLTVTRRPWIDSVFPSVVTAGKPAQLTVYGRNLPEGKPAPGTRLESATTTTASTPQDTLDFPGRLLPSMASIDGHGVRISGAGGASNPAFVAITSDPVVLDNRENDVPEKAQAITPPCVIAGLVEKARDRDYFAFDAKKGEVYVIEGFADRVRSPIDLVVQLRRLDNGQIVGTYDENSSIPTNVDRFYTFTNDPLGRYVVPEDGKYELLVRSQAGDLHAGPRHTYHVSVRKETPDFNLVVVGNHEYGSGLTLHRGGSYDISVFCFRNDGFHGEVDLAVEGLPSGVTCAAQRIGPRQGPGALVLTAADNAADWAGAIRIKGTAMIDGKPVVREARSGCIVYPTNQPNNPALSRLTRSLALAVRDKGPFRLESAEKAISVPAGGQIKVKVKVDRRIPEFKDNVSISAVSAPAQDNGKPINVAKVNIGADKDGEIKITVPSSTEAGLSTLVLRGTGKFDIVDEAKKKRNVTFSATLAPIALEVFKEAVEIDVPKEITLKAGEPNSFAVKIKRLHNFKGDVQVEFDAASNSGVPNVKETIKAGADSGILKITPAGNAKPKFDAVVRVLAKIDNVTLKQETKLNGAVDGSSLVAKAPPPKDDNTKAVPLLKVGSADWKYRAAAEVNGDAWRGVDFDDKAWKSAKAPFGYGEDVIAAKGGSTVAETGVPLVCRRVFEVPSDVLATKGVTVVLQVASDDSATVYLNGKLADNDDADHEFSYWNREVVIPAALLRPGRNVIAVEVRNGAGSSDVFLDAAVTARVPKK